MYGLNHTDNMSENKFTKVKNFIKSKNYTKDVRLCENEFISFKCGIAKPFGRKDTQELRDMGFVIGDIHTTQEGSKYNPVRVLHIWLYPKGSEHLE